MSIREEYEAKWGKGPHYTADALITKGRGNNLVILMGSRNAEDKKLGGWAMPGGFIESGETFIEAAIREAQEELGADLYCHHYKSHQIFDGVDRDPRSHMITTAVHFHIPDDEILMFQNVLRPSKEISTYTWLSLATIVAHHREMFIDHAKIINVMLQGSKDFD